MTGGTHCFAPLLDTWGLDKTGQENAFASRQSTDGVTGNGLRAEGEMSSGFISISGSNSNTFASLTASLNGATNILDRAWIAHGFNPLQDWASFRQKYEPGPDGVYYNQTLAALESRNSESDAQVTPVLWNSNAGWLQAIGLTIAKGGVAAEKWGIETTDLLNSVLDDFIESGLTEARLESIRTSEAIEREVLKFLQSKSPADQAETSIYLLGHSRGGEVVSRAMASLRPKLSSLGVASQLFILDAYGRDWPGISSALGTESPFPVGNSQDYNLLVDVGLDQLLTIGRSVTESLVDEALGQIAGDAQLPEPLVPDDIYSASLWRAPTRDGMANYFLPGTNHISLPDAFFQDEVTIREPDTAADVSLSFDDFFSPEQHFDSGDPSPKSLPLFKQIRRGSAKRILEEATDFQILAQGLINVPESAMKLIDIFSSPDSWLRGHWNMAGNVSMDVGGERIRLMGDNSSISQLVSLPPGTSKIQISGIQFDGSGLPGDSIQLLFDDSLVGMAEGQDLINENNFEFTIQNDGEQSMTGSLELRYRTEADASSFALTSISLAEKIPHVEVYTTNAFSTPRLQFFGSEDFESVADFYLESNGVPGLQLGPSGDVELQLQADANLVSAELPRLKSPPEQLLMAFQLQTGVNVYSEVPIRSRFQTNILQPMDVSEDTFVTPLDALIVINYLNIAAESNRALTPVDARVDATMDGFATPLDALVIINHLNQPSFGGEAEHMEDEDGYGEPISATVDWSWLELRLRRFRLGQP